VLEVNYFIRAPDTDAQKAIRARGSLTLAVNPDPSQSSA
jgi:hypothetical protein